MGLLDRILGPLVEQRASEKIADWLQKAEERLQEALKEASEPLQKDDVGWQLLSSTATPKDLQPMQHKKQQEEAWLAYMMAPMAKRQVETGTTYLAGKGFQITSIVPEVQEVIDDFVSDPDNHWIIAVQEIANRYQIEGECPVILYVNTRNGRVLFRDFDSREVEAIERDPNDPRKLLAIRRVYAVETWDDKLTSVKEEQRDEVIRNGEADPRQPDVIRYIVYFKVPTVSNRVRGLSTLASHLYWLKMFKKVLDARAVMNVIRASLVWDVSVEGTPKDVDAEAKRNATPPQPGTVKVHSSTVTWQALTPKIEAHDASEDVRAIKLQAVTGSGMPEHVLTGDASHDTYAGAEAAMRPYHMSTLRFQLTFGAYLSEMIYIVIEAAAKYGKLKDTDVVKVDSDGTITIKAPVRNDEDRKEPKTLPRHKWFQIVFPVVEKEDELRQSRSIQTDYVSGFCSAETASQRRGYDYWQERKRIDEERKRGIVPPTIGGFRGQLGSPGVDPTGGGAQTTAPRGAGGGYVPSGTGQTSPRPGGVDG